VVIRRIGTARRRDRVERQLVWVFGSPRTGTTWLLNLVGSHPVVEAMDEPGIGMHLALFAPEVLGVPADGFRPDQMRVNDSRSSDDDYFFASRFRDVWLPSVRALILDRMAAQLTAAKGDPDLLLVKEPNGSLGADLVMRALPSSRLLWVQRDGRDVVDSQLDAAQKGSWLSQFGGGMDAGLEARMRFLVDRAHLWVARTTAVGRAYDAHEPTLRLTVRYEDILEDTTGNLRRIYAWLGVAVPDDVEDLVRRLSFESLPAEHRGSGRFARAASPGLWRENLASDEQRAVTEVMASTLASMGYVD
jgi:hypothetical protein